MFHQIYTKPFTRCNEAWNFDDEFDSSPREQYRDARINGDNMSMRKQRSIFCDFYKYFAIDIATHQRIKFIISELTRISKFSIDEIRQTMLQYKDTLKHNYDHYHWLCHNEIEQIVNKL